MYSWCLGADSRTHQIARGRGWATTIIGAVSGVCFATLAARSISVLAVVAYAVFRQATRAQFAHAIGLHFSQVTVYRLLGAMVCLGFGWICASNTGFVHDVVLPRLTITRRAEKVALHPVCSAVKLNLTPKLEGIGKACSKLVMIPAHAGCCGFAGDRGFLFPELTEAATRREADELASEGYDAYVSSSRTCEIGMTRATGHVFRSYVYLLEYATRP